MVESMLDEIYSDCVKIDNTEGFTVLNKIIKNIVKNPSEQK